MGILLNQVNYTYGKGSSDEKQALQDIHIEIGENEMIALVGHTGSGKSTLVQIMNGLERADSGNVFFHGKDIYDRDFSMKELRSKVGLVFQYPEHQLFEATVIEDVEFGPKNMGWSQLEVELNSFQALKDAGIGEDLLDVSPLALSGGQKRRVALAGVLAMKPEILILDEPMAGLDPAGRSEIFELLMRIHRERKITILFVSHSMEDVAAYADRVIVMHQGKIVLDGAPKKVFHYEKELESIGLSVPQTTHLMHQLEKRGIDCGECLTPQEAVAAIQKIWQKKRGEI